MILQTSFDGLVAPEFLTTELAILVVFLLYCTLYASIRYRTLFGIFGWMIMLTALMITMFTNLRFIWFWLAVIAEGFVIVLAAMEYIRAAARGND